MSSTSLAALSRPIRHIPRRGKPVKGGAQVGGVWKGADRRAGGCRSRAEVTGGGSVNGPSQVEVRNVHYSFWMLFVVNSNQFNCSIRQL